MSLGALWYKAHRFQGVPGLLAQSGESDLNDTHIPSQRSGCPIGLIFLTGKGWLLGYVED